MKKVILLDLDGVLVDWVGGTCKALDVDRAALEADWGESWNIATALGITDAEMWAKIDEGGVKFWSELKPYPWCAELFQLCNELADTFILTSPSRSHVSPAGKVLWMDKHLAAGESFRDFLMGPKKELCARPNSILIDDRDQNCDLFRGSGGRALVFPRVWNSRRQYADDPMAYVRAVLPECL